MNEQLLSTVILLVALLFCCAAGIVSSRSVSHQQHQHRHQYHHQRLGRAGIEPPNKSIYLLISTSSKIYCMRMPDLDRVHNVQAANYMLQVPPRHQQQTQTLSEVIYEEPEGSANWITDAFYVKSEDLVYVNVYNSTAASSTIFTLRKQRDGGNGNGGANGGGEWKKRVLYTDQAYCLGITYNERKRELYWTASKAIVSGSSSSSRSSTGGTGTSEPGRTLFSLNSAKKLLYLKYDPISDSIYVSTLHYVYACSLFERKRKHSSSSFSVSGGNLDLDDEDDCVIVARDLQSARGLQLDEKARLLYVVDHKKRTLKTIRLDDNESSDASRKKGGEAEEEKGEKTESTSSSSMIQGIQQFVVNKHLNTDEDNNKDGEERGVSTVLNKKRLPSIGDIFYISLYKNRYDLNMLLWTEFSGKIRVTCLNNTLDALTIFDTREYTYSINVMDNSTTMNQPEKEYNLKEEKEESSDSVHATPTSTTSTASSRTTVVFSTSTSSTTTSTTSTTTTTTTTTTATSTSSTRTMVDKPVSSLPVILMTAGWKSTRPFVRTTQPISNSNSNSNSNNNNKNEEDEITFFENDDYDNEPKREIEQLLNEEEQAQELGEEKRKQFNFIHQGQQQQQQQKRSPSGSTNGNGSSSSPQLSVALYIVMCLLCFSLVINIILLYVSKRRQALALALARNEDEDHHHDHHDEKQSLDMVVSTTPGSGKTMAAALATTTTTATTNGNSNQQSRHRLQLHSHNHRLNINGAETATGSSGGSSSGNTTKTDDDMMAECNLIQTSLNDDSDQ